MPSLLVCLQLLDYHEPQGETDFCRSLLYFQKHLPNYNVDIKLVYRSKSWQAGLEFMIKAKKGQFDYMFITGGDIVLRMTTVMRLYELDVPIASGLTVGARGFHKPILFNRVGKGQYEQILYRGAEGLITCNNSGTGCLLLKKEVFDKLPNAAFSAFDSVHSGDSAFFENIYGLGYKVIVDPNVNVGHIGHFKKIYTLADYLKSFDQRKTIDNGLT